MKTFAGVVINTGGFCAIWFLASFVAYLLAFRGMGGSGIAEYLRLGVMWFVCPGVGAYYAPKVTFHFLRGANVDSVMASFMTLVSLVFALLLTSSIFLRHVAAVSVWERVQLGLQFASAMIGTLLGKFAVKEGV